MKKNIRKVLALMLVLCASISGCGTKKQTTQEKTTSQKTAAILLPPCSIGSFSQISEVLPWLSLPLFFPFVYSTFYFPLATI